MRIDLLARSELRGYPVEPRPTREREHMITPTLAERLAAVGACQDAQREALMMPDPLVLWNEAPGGYLAWIITRTLPRKRSIGLLTEAMHHQIGRFRPRAMAALEEWAHSDAVDPPDTPLDACFWGAWDLYSASRARDVDSAARYAYAAFSGPRHRVQRAHYIRALVPFDEVYEALRVISDGVRS